MDTKYKNGERLEKSVSSIKFKAGPQDGLAEGEFTAYAAVFNNIDSYGDKIIKGAFADTLSEWNATDNFIPLLFGHNLSDPDFNLGAILDAVEDDNGLLVHGQLDLTNSKSMQVYKMLKGKRLNQLSFAYVVNEGAWVENQNEGGGGFYELRALELLEVSLVTVGANRLTEVLDVKAHGTKAGKTISADTAASISSAIDAAKAVLLSAQVVVTELEELLTEVNAENSTAKAAKGYESKSASTGEPVSDEEPLGVKSATPMRNVSVAALEAKINLLAL